MADFEKIFVLKDQGEASFLEVILDERKIPHLIRSYHDSAYDGLFQMQKGWGVLYAAEEHREIINTLRSELDASSQERELDKP